MSWPTTRKFPRSMREAWPQHHADAVEHYTRRGIDALTVVVWFVCCCFIGWMAVQSI